jgi:hypothetical protein
VAMFEPATAGWLSIEDIVDKMINRMNCFKWFPSWNPVLLLAR